MPTNQVVILATMALICKFSFRYEYKIVFLSFQPHNMSIIDLLVTWKDMNFWNWTYCTHMFRNTNKYACFVTAVFDRTFPIHWRSLHNRIRWSIQTKLWRIRDKKHIWLTSFNMMSFWQLVISVAYLELAHLLTVVKFKVISQVAKGQHIVAHLQIYARNIPTI